MSLKKHEIHPFSRFGIEIALKKGKKGRNPKEMVQKSEYKHDSDNS